MIDGLVLNMPGLPTKPKDPAGRLVKWVLLAQAPGFVYGEQTFRVDGAFIDRQLADFGRLTKSGYTPPLLREHTRAGERSGDVLKLARKNIDGRPALLGAVAFSDPLAADKIKRGEIKYVSPAFGPMKDDRGQEFTFVLREVSLVAAPHQKHLSQSGTHVLGAETTTDGGIMPHKPEEEEMAAAVETEETEEKMMAIEARLAKIEEAMASMAELKELMETAIEMAHKPGHEDDEEAEAAEVAAGESEADILRARIDALEIERDRAVWDTEKPGALKFTAELAEVLFGAWRNDKETIGAVLKEARVELTEAPAKVEEAAPVNPFAVRMTESGTADAAPVTDADISAEALRVAGGDQIKALAIYKQLKSQRLN